MPDRKKPTQRRSEKMVADILTAASAVVTETGFKSATLEKIATKAGVSPGSIYQYFTNKKSLVSGFVVNELDENRQTMLLLMRQWQDLPIRELNRNVILFMAAYFQKRSETYRQVFINSPELGQTEIHMKMRREVIAGLAQILKRHQSELVVKDCEKAAAVVIHSVMGILTAPLLDSQLGYSMEELCEDAIQMNERYLLG